MHDRGELDPGMGPDVGSEADREIDRLVLDALGTIPSERIASMVRVAVGTDQADGTSGDDGASGSDGRCDRGEAIHRMSSTSSNRPAGTSWAAPTVPMAPVGGGTGPGAPPPSPSPPR